jgi:uncharacterized protein (TIGR00255 family)
MFISMTGSATRKVPSKWGDFTFVLSSFNHRFLEISTHLPDELRSGEVDIQKLIRGKIARGQVNFHLEWEPGGEEKSFRVNTALLKNYHRSLEEVKKNLGLKQEVSLSLLMQLPDVLIHKRTFLNRNLWMFLKKNINITLDELAKVRRKEGAELHRDIEKRIHAISKSVQEIKVLLPSIVKQYKGKLEHRISNNQNNGLKEKIAQEVMIQAGKVDITEEMIRVSSHLKMFIDEMSKKNSSGKRMDFISQEMLREINTMGSKICNAGISSKVIYVKTELDKIREQIRNVE